MCVFLFRSQYLGAFPPQLFGGFAEFYEAPERHFGRTRCGMSIPKLCALSITACAAEGRAAFTHVLCPLYSHHHLSQRFHQISTGPFAERHRSPEASLGFFGGWGSRGCEMLQQSLMPSSRGVFGCGSRRDRPASPQHRHPAKAGTGAPAPILAQIAPVLIPPFGRVLSESALRSPVALGRCPVQHRSV